MKRIAIILSGQMRSFERCLPTMNRHLFPHFPGADFYVSTVQDEDTHKVDLLAKSHPASRIHIEVAPFQPECLTDFKARGGRVRDNWQVGQIMDHEPYGSGSSPSAHLAQYWQQRQAWRLFEKARGEKTYDVIVRCRPDLWFHGYTPPPEIPGDQSLLALTPWWGRWGGCNDRFALLGQKAARSYYNVYDTVPELQAKGCPFHTECIYKAALEEASARVLPIVRADFATLRTNGEHRPQEISLSDQASLAYHLDALRRLR